MLVVFHSKVQKMDHKKIVYTSGNMTFGLKVQTWITKKQYTLLGSDFFTQKSKNGSQINSIHFWEHDFFTQKSKNGSQKNSIHFWEIFPKSYFSLIFSYLHHILSQHIKNILKISFISHHSIAYFPIFLLLKIPLKAFPVVFFNLVNPGPTQMRPSRAQHKWDP